MVAMGITIFGAMVVLKSDLEVVGTEKASFRALQLAEMGIAVAAHNDIKKYDNILSQPPGCLLYTSPSPRDGLLSRMPSSA